MNAEELQIQLPHIQLAALRWGDPHKPVILALHGWLDNARSFEPLAYHWQDYLADYQLIAIDWPGHGLSQHRPGAYPLHWVDYLYDLEVLFEHLSNKYTIAALLGHSLGGIVASAYTATFAQRVQRLILIEAISPLYEQANQSTKRLRKSFTGHRGYLDKMNQPSAVYDNVSVAVKARHRLTKLAEPWCQIIVERNMRPNGDGVSWCSDPRLKLDSPMRLTFEQVDSLMQHIETPTLLITATDGLSYLQQDIPQALNWFQNIEQHTLAGDHHLHMENSQGVMAVMSHFLTGKS